MQINFTVDGITELSRNMRLAVTELGNGIEEFHGEAVRIIKNRSDELFKGEGATVQNGPTWKQLSPVTLDMRRRRSGYYKKTPKNPGVLRWTGNLQDSAVEKSDKREGSLAYTAPYAIKHQRGEGVPRRKIIDIDNKTANNIVKALQVIVNQKLRIFGRQK